MPPDSPTLEPSDTKNMELFDAFYKNSHGVRRFGAASVDLCFLAAGRFDAYWEFDLKAWDIAAGKIIVEEAGGTVTNMDGSTLDPKTWFTSLLE